MTESAVCPHCNGHAVLKRLRVHRRTGAILPGKKQIWSAIGLFVLSWVLGTATILVGAERKLMWLTIAGAYLWLGGIIASIVILVRYLRAPRADWLECTSCGYRWQADAQEMKRLRQEIQRRHDAAEVKAGSVVIPFDTLPQGVYAESDLGLKPLDTCVYCGVAATGLLPQAFVHQIKDAEGKKVESEWALKFDLPYCEAHARTHRRNAAIYQAAFGIGVALGIALLFLWFARDPEQALRSMLKPLSYLLPQAWMALIAMVGLWAIAVFIVGGLVMLLLRLAGSVVFPSMRDHPIDGMLGVSHLMDGTERVLTLRFKRAQTAIDYQALNHEALQSLISASEEKKQAEEAAEVQRVQAEAEASRPAAALEAERVQAELASHSAVCWYCEKDRPADGTPHNVVLFKKEGEERLEQTVWVPRCLACQEVHRVKQPKLVVALLTLLTMAPCIVIGVLFGSHNRLSGWAWVIGTAVSFIVLVIVVSLSMSSLRRRAAAQGTRLAAVANAVHPEVKALLDQGWQVDTIKTGSAQTTTAA